MHKNKDQLYEVVKDLKTKNDFEKEIKKIRKEYDDLLDEDAAALLIVDELGRNKQNICKISDLKSDTECTVFGKITKISESRNFKRKNGSNGMVVNLELSDETGTCKLVLWNKDVELLKNKVIKKGTNVKVVNGYVKDGFNCLELNVGRWGFLEIEPEQVSEINNKKSSDKKVLRGMLVDVEPTRTFFRDNGEIGFVTKIKIKEKNTIRTLTVWDEKVKEIRCFKKGDSIEIDEVDVREKNGKKEEHVNGRSIIRRI
ncbi:MAG: OB-fold nucleic acid binding domain-containing protein [Candidatus Thermoplasmatota archaeon]|jgi:replication factor A1|nr:OB-fold nucleic acid binding domain-containing protein [Candidatus Thermoplasmatota archaeon]